MVYFDNAATTPVPKAVADAMYEVLTAHFGNPSSQYPIGVEMKKAVEGWRAVIAGALGCPAERLYFTSCGTESDNWAILEGAYLQRRVGRHIISYAVEHDAVRKPLVIRPQGIIAVRNLAGDHRRSLPRLIEHILSRAKQFAGRHQRAFLPPASPAECVNPPQRRGKQREHAVVFAVIGAPQHDGVCGDLPHLFLSPLPVLHTRDKLRGKSPLPFSLT